MNTDEFDELIRAKFDKGEFSYNQANWSRLSAQLPDKKPWNRTAVLLFLVSGVAACFALTLTVTTWLQHRELKYPHGNMAMAKQNSKPEQPKQNNNNNIVLAALPKTIGNLGGATSNRKGAVARENKTAERNAEKNYVALNNQTVAHGLLADNRKEKKSGNAILPQMNTATDMNYTLDEAEQTTSNEDVNRKIKISLAGGLNYGASNNGFMLGAVAQKRIGRKVYLEGNIAYVGNNFSQQQNNTVNSFDPKNVNTAAASETRAFSTVSSLHYLQVTPSVGYNVLKHLSVGVGADFQQLMNAGQSNYIADGETIKELPELDMGIVGKTEYMVSRRLSAGVLYREGVNNIIAGGNKYFDRSYLQVQLKVNVLGK